MLDTGIWINYLLSVGMCGRMLRYMDIASADVKRKQRALRKAFLSNDLFIKSFQLNSAVWVKY